MPRHLQEGGSNYSAEADALYPYFADSEFAQHVVKQLEEFGYVVLPGTFSTAEADLEYTRMWDWVQTIAPGISRTNPESWWAPYHGAPDPWPCAQRDMMQLYQAGWVFNDLREMFAERVFERLYGTRALHCSKDGFTLQRPTRTELKRTPNDHFDQGASMQGLHCVQGSVALTDQEENDGCFLVWPGSHQWRETLLAQPKYSKKSRDDFIIIDESDKETLFAAGIAPLRVPVNRGDVILWRSDVCHCGAPPLGVRDNFRAVVYVCCLPAVLTSEATYRQKRRAYDELQTGSHWPSREEWFKPSKRHEQQMQVVRPYWRDSPQLSQRQMELYGLTRYDRQTAACEGSNDTLAPEAPSQAGSGRQRDSKRWARTKRPS